MCKRVEHVDTPNNKKGAGLSRRGYRASDGEILKMLGVGAGLISTLVLALYIDSSIARSGVYSWPTALWILPASVMFWLCHVWITAERRELHDDPLIFALRDRVSWLIGVVAFAGLAIAWFAPPLALTLP